MRARSGAQRLRRPSVRSTTSPFRPIIQTDSSSPAHSGSGAFAKRRANRSVTCVPEMPIFTIDRSNSPKAHKNHRACASSPPATTITSTRSTTLRATKSSPHFGIPQAHTSAPSHSPTTNSLSNPMPHVGKSNSSQPETAVYIAPTTRAIRSNASKLGCAPLSNRSPLHQTVA